MSRVTPAILLLLLACHPLFNVVRALGSVLVLGTAGGLPVTFPLAEVAYVVELVIAGGITWQLRPAVAAWRRAPVAPRPPGGMQPRLDGFLARMERPWAVGSLLTLVGVGVAASCMGVFLQISTEMLLDPVGWQIDNPDPLPRPVMLFGLVFVATVVTALHGIAQGMITLIVVFARAIQSVRRSRHTVELTGRRLRVGRQEVLVGPDAVVSEEADDDALRIADGVAEVRVWGDPRELRWLAERLVEVRVDGTAADVPETLRQVRGVAESG